MPCARTIFFSPLPQSQVGGLICRDTALYVKPFTIKPPIVMAKRHRPISLIGESELSASSTEPFDSFLGKKQNQQKGQQRMCEEPCTLAE